MQMRLFVALAFGLFATALSAQDKTLTFDNASPAKTVHLQNGTSVSIGTTGNLIAKCTLDPVNTNNCADIGTGTGSNAGAPNPVQILASNFSTVADATGAYNPGTTFTITPTVGNSPTVCWQRTSGASAAGWGTMITVGFNNPVNVTLNTPLSTYGFMLECYNLSGGTDSSTITVSTNNGAPPPAGCTDITPPSGFTRLNSPTTWEQIAGATWPGHDLSLVTAVPSSPATGFSYLGTTLNRYTSIKFHTPSTGFNATSYYVQVTQISGTSPVSPVPGYKYTLTVSRCPGDFRVNIQSPVDSTEAQACKSVRYSPSTGTLLSPSSTINLNPTGVSSANSCGLALDTDYYLNLIMAQSTDGIQPNENNCDNNATSCGLMLYMNL